MKQGCVSPQCRLCISTLNPFSTSDKKQNRLFNLPNFEFQWTFHLIAILLFFLIRSSLLLCFLCSSFLSFFITIFLAAYLMSMLLYFIKYHETKIRHLELLSEFQSTYNFEILKCTESMSKTKPT